MYGTDRTEFDRRDTYLGRVRGARRGSQVVVDMWSSPDEDTVMYDDLMVQKVSDDARSEKTFWVIDVNGNGRWAYKVTPKPGDYFTMLQRERREAEAFRQQVVEKAVELAEEHDWCEVVEDALTDLGLEVPKADVEFTMEVRFRATGVSREMRRRVKEGLLDEWVSGSFQIDVSADNDGGEPDEVEFLNVTEAEFVD